MPLTIAICDDNENQIKELRRLLDEWSADKPFALAIDEYISAESFLFSYSDKPCDLLLLDIEMKQLIASLLIISPQRRHLPSVVECPNASPSVSPHSVQVLGAVQVAASNVCLCAQAVREIHTATNVKTDKTFFILNTSFRFVLIRYFNFSPKISIFRVLLYH